jgi:hypothetical protein
MYTINPILVAPEAVYLINKIVVPWKQKHADKLARLAEQEQQAIIETAKAVVLENQAELASDPSEIQKAKLEIERVWDAIEASFIEIQQQQRELQRQKIDLILDFLKSINPNISNEDKVKSTSELLPLIETFIKK